MAGYSPRFETAGAERSETAEREVALGKVTERAATRARGLLLGVERLTLTVFTVRLSACAPFRFFITHPLVS
jgi:hypothetical protein